MDGNGSTTGDFSFRVLDANIATTIDLDTTVEGTVDPNTRISHKLIWKPNPEMKNDNF